MTATFGQVRVLSEANYCDGHGHGSTLEVLNNATLTDTGDMYVVATSSDNGRSGTLYGYAQVYQHGGTVTVGGNLRMADNINAPSGGNGGGSPVINVKASYNLWSGGTNNILNVGGRILGGNTQTGYGQSFFNFHGGTLAYTGAGPQTDWINLTVTAGTAGTTSANNLRVWQGGTIDTGSQNLTINQAILAPTGQGISTISHTSPIDLTGTVYSSGIAPWVYIDGGGGSGATAVATLDPATNKINGIIVTNPGNDYATSPTVQLVEAGYDEWKDASANATRSDNPTAYPSGGLTKKGLGTLTLTSGANSYTGPTVVEAGTLALGSAGSIATSSGINLAAGTVLNTTAQAIYTMAATPKTYTLHATGTGSGSCGSIMAAGLDITNAVVTVTQDTTLDDPVYVLASYTTLTGAAFASPPVVGGYNVVYNYNSGTQIALVKVVGGYPKWASDMGLDGTVGKENGKLDDPDGDGVKNIIEFAINGNPLNGADNGRIYSFAADSDMDDPDTQKELILTVAVRSGTAAPFTGSPLSALSNAADAIRYTIEGSNDLSDFSAAVWPVSPIVPINPVTGLPYMPGTGYEFRSFSLVGSNGLPGKGFLRVKVESIP